MLNTCVTVTVYRLHQGKILARQSLKTKSTKQAFRLSMGLFNGYLISFTVEVKYDDTGHEQGNVLHRIYFAKHTVGYIFVYSLFSTQLI